MVINQFKIVNNDNSKGLKFHYIESIQDSVTLNNISYTLAGSDSSSNYISNWGGNDRLITANFVLMNDGTDKSTDSSSIITLSQQWDYLMDQVVEGYSTDQSDVTHTLTIYRDGSTTTKTGIIDNINIDGNPSTAGNKITGNLTLKIGTN